MGTTITKKDSMVHIEFGDGSGIILAANDKAVPKENSVQRGLEELRRHVDRVNELRGLEGKLLGRFPAQFFDIPRSKRLACL